MIGTSLMEIIKGIIWERFRGTLLLTIKSSKLVLDFDANCVKIWSNIFLVKKSITATTIINPTTNMAALSNLVASAEKSKPFK